MQALESLPEPIQDIRRLLEPFVKQRQEVAQIRRVLALHLSSHVNPQDGLPISQPSSLVSGSKVGSATSGVRGIRREYLRCLRANTKAREEYQKIRKEHQNVENQRLETGIHKKDHDTSTNSLELFLDVVKYRRKHESLRIIQDYLDMLAQKPAASADHLDPQVVLSYVDPLPSVPSDVMVDRGPYEEFRLKDLNELVDQLEKSVMRAQLLLKREQKLLAKVRLESRSSSDAQTQSGGRLQALGMARNELINWIERELAKAGEKRGEEDLMQSSPSLGNKGNDYINCQLSFIQKEYAHYTNARQALIIATSGSIDASAPRAAEDHLSLLETKDEVEMPTTISHVLQPYIERLTSVSNQQKSVIQQKSHLTISLAKQLKEGGQGLDRLADESHLLPAYPLGSLQVKGLKSSLSFGEEIASHEKPDSSHHARNWVHASEASTIATYEAVTDRLEEGRHALLDARQTMLDLQSILGGDTSNEGDKNNSKDMWAALDGGLGVIARDEIEL
ncbi:hypothetical protein D0Z07_2719 [Hyphodiscus hymeniophilus]|uniref:Uncharacterized protein n=1 Tax=Hyphodiscus hymeniophilus TaxID=353542 RepID=A0A9P7AZ97_9HELO|nr:hypothetical protein D0Z07_2719 [Hyphodiscus hymeniophilus]